MKSLIAIVLVLLATLLQAQKWQIIHGASNKSECLWDLAEDYDRGFLVSGDIDYKETWEIKTDINGYALYDKRAGSTQIGCYVRSITKSPENGFILSGAFNQSSTFNGMFIMKLNLCGEKEWCKFILHDMPARFLDHIILDDGNILALARLESNEQNEQIFLYCFRPNGNLLWRKAYATKYMHPEIAFALGYDLYKFGNSYLISGYCYWPYPGNPTVVWMRPMFIKIRENFNEEWLLPYGINDSIIGKAFSVIKYGGEYVGFGQYIFDENSQPTDNSVIMRFNEQGFETGYVLIKSDSISPEMTSNFITEVVPKDDSLFIAAANFGPLNEGNPYGEFIFDLEGKVYKYQNHEGTCASIKVRKTSDNKYLFGTSKKQGSTTMRDIYLYKLNENLEEDTLYTGNFTFDSLCPEPIQSGTIEIGDCDIIVSTEEIPSPEEYYALIAIIPIKAYPNPAQDVINFEFENTEHHQNISLTCHDVFGRPMHEERIATGQRGAQININSWAPGLYLTVVKSDGKVVGRCRFLVK